MGSSMCVVRRGEAQTEGRDGGDGEILSLEVGSGQSRDRQGRAVFELLAAFWRESGLLELLPLVLVASVLKPDLHLSLCEVQHGRELLSLVRSQILLHGEASLQLVHLGVREEGPGSPLLVFTGVCGRTCTRRKNKQCQ